MCLKKGFVASITNYEMNYEINGWMGGIRNRGGGGGGEEEEEEEEEEEKEEEENSELNLSTIRFD